MSDVIATAADEGEAVKRVQRYIAGNGFDALKVLAKDLPTLLDDVGVLVARLAAAETTLQEIAGDGHSYAPCLPECVEGPPTCDCAEERARIALARRDNEGN